MRVELISVGTELLLGDIVNTNTAYLSKELAALGLGVFRQTTVGDNRERLLKTLESAFFENDTVIITGGISLKNVQPNILVVISISMNIHG